MQISSNLMFDRSSSRMSQLMATATKLNVQIATGKKISTPSENVTVAQQIAEFDRKDADAAAYAINLKLSESLLKQADSTLGQITEQLQRATDLVTQAATGTLSDSNRKVIGSELSALVDAMVGLGNTKDLRGQPLFGSASGTDAVIRNANGTFTYNTAPKLSEIPIGDGLTVQPTETASRVFNSGAGDTLAMLAQLASALQTGTDQAGAARDALAPLKAAGDQVSVVQASVGARAARVDLQQGLLQSTNLDRAELRSSMEDIDVTETYAELSKTLTILSATQQSFSKLSQLSLFNYLR
ncbi:flagellin N-terminal helical domain-containing protein [Sphingomonas adhaesiva]|uniref:flagellin N-terminal helical domain-containing protein n=1 Tax=Sphingomonas adhaesiva TaxID=28212 RepID=UPI002FFB5832